MDTEQLYSENDTRPFASYTYELIKDGPGPQELRPDVRDTDVLLLVEPKRNIIRLLHLYHVRQETSAAAKAAINDFLDRLESFDDENNNKIRPFREFHMIGSSFDDVHSQILEWTEEEIEKRSLLCDWETTGWPRPIYRRCRNQVKYNVFFRIVGAPGLILGTRPVMPGSERVLTGFEE